MYFRLKDFLELGSDGREAGGGWLDISGGDDGATGTGTTGDDGGGSFETTISDAGDDIVRARGWG